MGEEASSKTRLRVVIVAAVNIITLAFLAWTLRNFRFAQLVEDLKAMNWWWVALAIAADFAGYCLQAVRWRWILRPIEPVSFWNTLRAIYVGLFGNESIGFNAGEVVRTYLITRWTGLPFSVSLASAVIERIVDGIWLCGCLFLALRLVPRPHHMRLLIGSEYALLIIVLIGTALLAIAFYHPHHAHRALSNKNWQRHIRVLIDDLSLIGHSRYLYIAFAFSLFYLLFQSIPFYATIKGYGFEGLGIPDAFAMMVIMRVGGAVPQAPGNVGLYLMANEIMKRIFAVPARDADSFSMVLWGILTLRLVIGGITALTIAGAGLGELRRAAHAHHAEHARSRQ